MIRPAFLVAVFGGLWATASSAEEPRQALALKVEAGEGKDVVTVAFNYTGKPGDPPTFAGVRLYRYEVPVGKAPTRVGWEGKEGRETVVLAGKRYTYFPARADRQENGTLAVAAAPGGKLRLTGVYYAFGTLFVVDETVRPGEPVLLEAADERQAPAGAKPGAE